MAMPFCTFHRGTRKGSYNCLSSKGQDATNLHRPRVLLMVDIKQPFTFIWKTVWFFCFFLYSILLTNMFLLYSKHALLKTSSYQTRVVCLQVSLDSYLSCCSSSWPGSDFSASTFIIECRATYLNTTTICANLAYEENLCAKLCEYWP